MEQSTNNTAPPVACPLTDALNTALETLRRDAALAKLPTVSLCTFFTTREGQLLASFHISATGPGLGIVAQGDGPTLAQAEEKFYSALNKWDERHNYEADASREIDAQVEAFQALEQAA